MGAKKVFYACWIEIVFVSLYSFKCDAQCEYWEQIENGVLVFFVLLLRVGGGRWVQIFAKLSFDV